MDKKLQPLLWVGSSKKALLKMPADVQDVFGFALHLAQSRQKHPDAKPLKGFGGISEAKMLACLNFLGSDVDIVVHQTHQDFSEGRTQVTFA